MSLDNIWCLSKIASCNLLKSAVFREQSRDLFTALLTVAEAKLIVTRYGDFVRVVRGLMLPQSSFELTAWEDAIACTVLMVMVLQERQAVWRSSSSQHPSTKDLRPTRPGAKVQ